MRTFDEMAREIHEYSRAQGFYRPSLASEKLMLIVSEVAEAQDALRNGDRENEAEEVADILIRTLDYAAWRGISLDIEVERKMERNRRRPVLHGRKAF